MKSFILHFLLHSAILLIAGVWGNLASAITFEAHDEWMKEMGKPGHEEGWSWADFFGRSLPSFIAGIFLWLLTGDLLIIFKPFWLLGEL